MIEIKIKDLEQFHQHNTYPSDDFLNIILAKKYPVQFKEALDNLEEFIDAMFPNVEGILTSEDIIEEIDDLIKEEVIINYFVVDECGTDKGTDTFIIENGYLLKEGI